MIQLATDAEESWERREDDDVCECVERSYQDPGPFPLFQRNFELPSEIAQLCEEPIASPPGISRSPVIRISKSSGNFHDSKKLDKLQPTGELFDVRAAGSKEVMQNPHLVSCRPHLEMDRTPEG